MAYGVTYRLAGQPEPSRGQFEIARAQLEEALALSPDEPRLLIALGETLDPATGQSRASRRTRDSIRFATIRGSRHWYSRHWPDESPC